MAQTRKTIFDKVSFLLKKENKFFTSSELHYSIGVDAFRRISEDIEYPRTNYSSYMSSGEYLVNLPSGFIKIDQEKDVIFSDSSDTYKLEPKRQKDIGRDKILTESPSTPENYFMEDEDTIGVYPPVTSGVIVIPYVKAATSLSSDSDTNEISENGYYAAVYWTMRECMLKDGDQRYTVYETLYNKEIDRLKRRYNEMFEQPYDICPHEDYLI